MSLRRKIPAHHRANQRGAAQGVSQSSSMVRVVVIGSGPVGAAAATRAAERGCATTLLEAGVQRPLSGLPSARAGEHIRNQPQYQREPEAFILEAMTACAFFDAAAPPVPGSAEQQSIRLPSGKRARR